MIGLSTKISNRNRKIIANAVIAMPLAHSIAQDAARVYSAMQNPERADSTYCKACTAWDSYEKQAVHKFELFKGAGVYSKLWIFVDGSALQENMNSLCAYAKVMPYRYLNVEEV